LPKKTFQAAAVANAHLIVQLKDNQPILCQKVEDACATADPRSSARTVDPKRRNRHETRAVTVFDAALAVAETEWEPHVAAIIKVERSTLVRQPATGLWKLALETSFYLSGRPIDANLAAHAIRKHWGIENNPTTPVMSLSAKTPRGFEPIPESSPDSGASPTISCAATNPTRSPKTASPQLSEASNQYFQ
jgi:hypothetical protein